ncbi:MAG: DUF5682 family protein [Pseudomonadota bacterium]
MPAPVHILGIRHHGPGSAASLVRALDALAPAHVLIEGPPEASDLISLATLPGMAPPIALLVYPKGQPEVARFYPFAEYSPEWQAMRWALRHEVPVEFVDQPFELPPEPEETTESEDADTGSVPEDTEQDTTQVLLQQDPLQALATAAGHSDGEAWWNALVEQSVNAPSVFEAITKAMASVRESADEIPPRELAREAFMRLRLRQVEKESDGPVAFICGAWHAPALLERPSLAQDRALVKGRKRVNVEGCWVPWTDRRLAYASGYGAGVLSPGWYRHLWQRLADGDVVTLAAHWQAQAAELLRASGVAAATASVIEAVRLAVNLAALRELPVPGLTELQDASLATLCHGDEVMYRLVQEQLVIGERVGEVDESAPQPPLQADLTRQQKRLRLKPEATPKDISLDLRTEAGLAKSTLLHRLVLLEVTWGELLDAAAGRGTFREVWRLLWEPEHSVKLAEATLYGPTIAQAAAARATAHADEVSDCLALAELVRHCLLSDLPEAAERIIDRLQAVAVDTNDVFVLMQALSPMVEVQRYGSARQLPTAALDRLIDSLAVEVIAGIDYGIHGLDAQGDQEACTAIRSFHRSIALVGDEPLLVRWRDALGRLRDDRNGAPGVRGLSARLRYDDELDDSATTAKALSQALSPATAIDEAGRWLEGFLGEHGDVLLLDDTLLTLVDGWLTAQDEDTFLELIPMMRRAFSNFDANLRRRLLDLITRGSGTSGKGATHIGEDAAADAAFARALPLLNSLLGVSRDE